MSRWKNYTVLDRMVLAVERVRQRMLRATGVLEAAGIPYAVVGGNAVAAWVASVEPSAVRNTQDVDILLRRQDLDAVKKAMQAAGFIYGNVAGIDLFLDGPEASVRDAVHVVFASEKVRADYVAASPGIEEISQQDAAFRVVSLDALVRMKLTSFRRKDQVHLLDLLGVGLIDRSWLAKLPPALAGRLRELLDTPDD
jgi:hypothetical protein